MTLTTEQLRALRDALKSWQDGYDPVDDKEQYEMLVTAETAVGELLANREAQPVAFPQAKDKSQGWKIDPEYLQAIADAVGCSDDEGTPSMELVEAVLLAAAPPAPAVVNGRTAEGWMAEALLQKNVADALRKSLPAVPDKMTAVVKDEAEYANGWNACRAAMLAQPVSGGYKLPDNVREALTLALQAMEFMGDTLNNIDAVCTEDVEYVTPAFNAVRELLAAAPEGGNDHDTRR